MPYKDKTLASYKAYRVERQHFGRARYAENREEALAYAKKRREELPETIAEIQRKTDSKRGAYQLDQANWRRAVKNKATPLWADRVAVKAIYLESMLKGLHVDHMVPLVSDLVCGLHWEGNLQLLTPEDNIRKGNRFWPDMW